MPKKISAMATNYIDAVGPSSTRYAATFLVAGPTAGNQNTPTDFIEAVDTNDVMQMLNAHFSALDKQLPRIRVSQPFWIATSNDSNHGKARYTIPAGTAGQDITLDPGLGDDLNYESAFVAPVGHFVSLDLLEDLDVEVRAGRLFLSARQQAGNDVGLNVRIVASGKPK